VRFAPTTDQLALASAVRELLEDACPPAVVRAAWTGTIPGGLWTRLAALGLLDASGLGLDEVDLVGVFVELGRAAVPLPVAETVTVLVPLLTEVEHPAVTALAAGELIGTAQLSGGSILPWGLCSDIALVGNRLLDLTGVPLDPVSTIDGSRFASSTPTRGFPLTHDRALLEKAWLRGALAAAAQLVGLAHRQLDLTVAYVRERRQFGVPVGSQQAVKHPLANALVELRFTLPVVQRAAVSLAAGSPDARAHVAAAKAMASRMAGQVARAAIQAHGAIGYTVEYDLHLYVKRSWALAASWGSEAHHRAVVASSLDLPPAVDPSLPPWEALS
jgi:alkylation response protein AidB-like acyl-CoA dehydrogenase